MRGMLFFGLTTWGSSSAPSTSTLTLTGLNGGGASNKSGLALLLKRKSNERTVTRI
jgi:hypothetical protein